MEKEHGNCAHCFAFSIEFCFVGQIGFQAERPIKIFPPEQYAQMI